MNYVCWSGGKSESSDEVKEESKGKPYWVCWWWLREDRTIGGGIVRNGEMNASW